MPSTQELKVLIIGGGLAGMLSARVLREHHSVTVLERCPHAQHSQLELGVGINTSPSAGRIMTELGFDRVRAKSIVSGRSKMFDRFGGLVNELDLIPVLEGLGVGADWWLQHRGLLWEEFHRLATGVDGDVPGTPAEVRWGVNVVDVDVEEGVVRVEGGEELRGDLIIGADGIKSIVRPLVVGDEAFRLARPSGISAYRFTLPAHVVREAVGEETPRLMDGTEPAELNLYLALDATSRSIVMYPCAGFELLNVVCIAPDSCIRATTTESWSAQGKVEDLLETFSDFGPFCRALLSRAENVKLWQLRDQDPLPTYIKGRTVLIGDAAHAMTPHQAQGGTQAIEDAEAFRLFSRPGVHRDGVPAILKDFDRVRRPRASRIQETTRQSQDRKTADSIYKHVRYNWTYPGVVECLKRLDEGKEMIDV